MGGAGTRRDNPSLRRRRLDPQGLVAGTREVSSTATRKAIKGAIASLAEPIPCSPGPSLTARSEIVETPSSTAFRPAKDRQGMPAQRRRVAIRAFRACVLPPYFGADKQARDECHPFGGSRDRQCGPCRLPRAPGSVRANAPFVAFRVEDSRSSGSPFSVLGGDHFMSARTDGTCVPVVDVGRLRQPQVQAPSRTTPHQAGSVVRSVCAGHHKHDVSKAYLRVENGSIGAFLA